MTPAKFIGINFAEVRFAGKRGFELAHGVSTLLCLGGNRPRAYSIINFLRWLGKIIALPSALLTRCGDCAGCSFREPGRLSLLGLSAAWRKFPEKLRRCAQDFQGSSPSPCRGTGGPRGTQALCPRAADKKRVRVPFASMECGLFYPAKALEQFTIENVYLLCKDLPVNPCLEIAVGGLCPPLNDESQS